MVSELEIQPHLTLISDWQFFGYSSRLANFVGRLANFVGDYRSAALGPESGCSGAKRRLTLRTVAVGGRGRPKRVRPAFEGIFGAQSSKKIGFGIFGRKVLTDTRFTL